MTNHSAKIVCLTALALLGAGWCVGQWRAQSTDAEMRHRLLQQAVHVAGTLDPVMIRELSFTAADQGTPAFDFVRKQMTALGNHMVNRGIYSMALRDGRIFFGPENYAEDDLMASPPGTLYEQPASDDVAVFTTGKPAVFGPITDEYGTFVTALAPVFDPNHGRVLMVVGIDTLAEDWSAILGRIRRQSMLASLIAAAALLVGAQVRSRWKRTCKPNTADPASRSPGSPSWRKAVPSASRHANAGLLIGMGVLAVTFLGVVLAEAWYWTREHIDARADQEARLVVEFDKALRDYVGAYIRPEMEKRVEQGEFLPEAMSTSFVARSVFDRVHEVLPDAVLRFPSTNPRNPVNQATPLEESLIRYFEQHPAADAWSGVMEFFEHGQKYFVRALPRRFGAGCLQCHGRPEDAPGSLVERYGPVAGFGRSVGDVSIDLAAIPVSAAYAASWSLIWRHMVTALGLCMLFLAGIGFLFWADLRRRRSAEAAIEKERGFLRLVIDSIPGFVCVKSEEGRFLIANEALARAYGSTVTNVEGKTDADFSPSPEQIDGYRRDDLNVITTRQTKVIPEEPITYADGTTHWLTTVKVPLIGDDGACRQLLAVATDVTERRHAEEERRESFSLLEATLEATADGILVVDHRGRIRDFNRQFQELWRIPDAVLESRDDATVLSAVCHQLKDPDSFLVTVRQLYDHPQRESSDTLEFADGRIIERYSKPQRLGDQIVGRVWSFRDATERCAAGRKQEALLQQVAAANEELTHFAYVVSHDLKAPLRGIKLITEWLCADYGDKLGEDAKEQLGLLQSRVARMHNLIDGVLQYSRVGRVQEQTEAVNLNELIADIIDGIAPAEHVHITVEEGLPTIRCERTRITQVFQNLLSNAIKYMDKPQGRITVACVQQDGFWRFSISDNGPGIEEKYFERIFKLFQTLAPRDEHESTGVGLAVVKKIVELYGGRVWVESQVGRGSTFFFTLAGNEAAMRSERSMAGAAC